MIPKTKGINPPESKMKYKPQQFYNMDNSPINSPTQVHHQNQDSNFLLGNQNKREKILHRSVKRNFDDEGNEIITTKIVREVDLDEGENILKTNTNMNVRQKDNYEPFYPNNDLENEISNNSFYSNNEEKENTSGFYNNPNFIFTPTSYNSYGNNYNRFNSYNSNVLYSDEERNYYSCYGKPINAKGINLQNSEINQFSPNYTSGSDLENNRLYAPIRNINNISYPNLNKTTELNKIQYKKYNIGSPSYKILNNNYNSPDMNINTTYNEAYYKKSKINKLRGAQPIYQEYHEKYNTRNNQFESSDEYDTSMSMNINNINRYNPRKKMHKSIIKEVQRDYPNNRETYDIVNECATLIQSHIRGFLVRKKVLRYITLAIYYQSFCDKIQDALCCHIRQEIFGLLIQKLKALSKYGGKIKKYNSFKVINKKNQFGEKKNSKNENYKNKIKENKFNQIKSDYKFNSEYKDKDYKRRTKYSENKKYKDEHLNRSINYSYNKYNKLDYSESPNSKIIHYFLNSTYSKYKPSHRYYKDISGNTSQNHYYNGNKNYESFKSLRTNMNKIYYFTEKRNKKNFRKENYYLNDENGEDYECFYDEKIYRIPFENYTSNNFQEKPENISGIGTRSISQNQQNIKIIRKFNENEIESDNYISINYVKAPGSTEEKKETEIKETSINTIEAKKYLGDKYKNSNKEENVKTLTLLSEKNKKKKDEQRSKSVSTEDKFTNTVREKNKISKREDISIIIKKKPIKKKKVIKKVKKVKKETNKDKARELLIKIIYKKILGDKMKLNNGFMKWFKKANKLKRLDTERKLRAQQEKKERERREKEKKEKEERDKEEKERREKEEQLLMEREKKLKMEKEKMDRERREMERQKKEDQLRREREEKERKEREEQERIERERQLKLEQERKERERKEKERKERLERERRERERKEKEEQLRLERERKIQEEKEREEKERKERERKEREEKLRKEREEREARLKKEREEREREERLRKQREEREERLKKEKEERERKEREEKLRKQREEREERLKKEREERERKEREEKLRKEREERQARLKKEREEKERKEKEEQLRIEREKRWKAEQEKREKERKERERKQKEEEARLAREKRMQEEKERREKERIEKERREREEKKRIEREIRIKEEQARREKEKKEKEKQKALNYEKTSSTIKKFSKGYKEKEENDKKQDLESLKNQSYHLRKEKQLDTNSSKYTKINKTQKSFGKEKKLYQLYKIDEEEVEEEKLNSFTSLKTQKSKNDSFEYLSPKKKPIRNKIQTSSSVEYLINPNLKTIKFKDEGTNVKFPPSFNPSDLKNQKETSESFKKKQKEEVILKTKKIDNINYVGKKKDCEKRLNELKMKMEEEFEKRMEEERKKQLEEQNKSKEKLEEKNRKEIERLKEIQRQKDIEREREIEREKELQKKRELENERQKEKEIKIGIETEIEKQRKLMEEKELEEKNRKRKAIKMNKEIEFNIENVEETKTILRNREEDIKKAKEIIKTFILSRGDPFLKMRKYFHIWRRNVKYLKLLEYSSIIQQYCKNNIQFSKLKKAIQKWKNLGKKIFYKTRIRLLKMKKRINLRKRKLYELIRITRLNTIFTRRRFIHYIILIWLIYAKNIHKKKTNMKYLYEHLLKTYMSLADDIFGNNKKENPSVQDAIYEAVNTDKFITLIPDDVPLARIYYEEVRKMKSADTKNRGGIFNEKTRILEKSSTTSKLEIEKKEFKKYFMGKINENKKEDTISENEESSEPHGKMIDTYNIKYESYNPGVTRRQKYFSKTSVEKNEEINKENNDTKNNKDEKKLKDVYQENEDKERKDENKFSYRNRFGKKYSKTEENNTENIKQEKENNEDADKYSYRKKYLNKSENKDDKKEEGKYTTKFGNKITLQGDVDIEDKDSQKEDKSENNKYNRFKGKFKGSIETKEDSNKDDEKESNNIRISAWNRFGKKNDIKDEKSEKNNFNKILEIKGEVTGNIKEEYKEESFSQKKYRFRFGSTENSVDDKNNKSNSESKFRFGYKSKYFSKENKTEDIKDEKNGNIVESNEDKSNRDNESYSQDSRKVGISKKYKSKRFSK